MPCRCLQPKRRRQLPRLESAPNRRQPGWLPLVWFGLVGARADCPRGPEAATPTALVAAEPSGGIWPPVLLGLLGWPSGRAGGDHLSLSLLCWARPPGWGAPSSSGRVKPSRAEPSKASESTHWPALSSAAGQLGQSAARGVQPRARARSSIQLGAPINHERRAFNFVSPTRVGRPRAPRRSGRLGQIELALRCQRKYCRPNEPGRLCPFAALSASKGLSSSAAATAATAAWW